MVDRVRLMERRDIDELIILDIAATPNNRGPRFEEVSRLCENLFCPVTVGGGVKNEADIQRLLRSGADKVAICTAAVEDPDFIDRAATRFGSQAVVASIDVGPRDHVWIRCGHHETRYNPVCWAREVEARGAGEILLNAIDKDGTLDGYDLDLIRDVSNAVSIPVIACGGCGSYAHMAEAIRSGAHAVAVGAAFQFTEATPKGASRYLHEQGFSVRL